MIRRILALFGLASAGQVARQDEELRRAAERARALEERLDKLRADAQTWKQRHDDTSRELASRQDAAASSAAEAAQRAQADAARWKERAERLTAQADELRTRVAEAERATTAAREHLMATEVKLDLIEAAIQVLDARTRETAVARVSETR